MEKRVFTNNVESNDSFKIPARRVLIPARRIIKPLDPNEVYERWSTDILTCLKPQDKYEYGHVDRTGKLWRLRTLTTEQVPSGILLRMEKENKIKLGEDGYYHSIME